MIDKIGDFFDDPNNHPDDTLLFYYSGHGVPGVDDTYLASSDIDPDKPYKRGFPFEDLSKMMERERCTATRVVVILDCCYSGAAKLSSKYMRTSKRDLTKSKIIGRRCERSRSINKHGVFYQIVKKFNGVAGLKRIRVLLCLVCCFKRATSHICHFLCHVASHCDVCHILCTRGHHIKV